jgi:hypothetical protein
MGGFHGSPSNKALEKGRAVDVKIIEREIEELPVFERSFLITQAMFDLCQKLFGEGASRDRLMELFGADCLEKVEKRLKTGV